MQLEIDSEFRDLIPPILEDERTELESSLKSEGCRDPILIWKNVIIDGHNRFDICSANSIEFKTRSIAFKDREDVKRWIITNQLARRNLTFGQKASLVLRRESLYKEQAKERQLSGLMKGSKKPVEQNSGQRGRNRERTDRRLAKEAGVSHDTIHRTRIVMNEGSEQIKKDLKDGKISVRKAYGQTVNKRKPIASQKDKADLIGKLSSDGFNVSQIAKKLNIAIKSVRNIANKNGIELSDRKIGNQKDIDVNRFISAVVESASSLSAGQELMFNGIDRIDESKIGEWISELKKAISFLNKICRKLERIKS